MWDFVATGIGIARRRRTQVRRAPTPTRYAVLMPPGRQRAVFVKTYARDAAAEFVRGRAIYEGGVCSGLYRAPQTLELVEPQGVILWEYISPLVESRDHLLLHLRRAEKEQRVSLFRRFGMALAAVHQSLSKLDTRSEYRPLGTIRSPYPELNEYTVENLNRGPFSPLHWDFVLGNIFMHQAETGDAEIVVVDAMPNFYLLANGGTNVSCPVHVDLAHMVFSISCNPRFSGWIRAEETDYWSALISGYRQVSGANVDVATTLAAAGEVTLRYQDYRDATQKHWSAAEWVDRRFRLACATRLFRAAKDSLIGRALAVTA